MEYYIGQTFVGKYPPEVVDWCYAHHAVIRNRSGVYVVENIPGPTEEELFEKLRSVRNEKIASVDYMVMSDYPIEETALEAVKTYRQALRDLPQQEGAPWDGGGEKTPWPAMPEIVVSGADPVAAEVQEVQKEDSSLQKGSPVGADAD